MCPHLVREYVCKHELYFFISMFLFRKWKLTENVHVNEIDLSLVVVGLTLIFQVSVPELHTQ